MSHNHLDHALPPPVIIQLIKWKLINRLKFIKFLYPLSSIKNRISEWALVIRFFRALIVCELLSLCQFHELSLLLLVNFSRRHVKNVIFIWKPVGKDQFAVGITICDYGFSSNNDCFLLHFINICFRLILAFIFIFVVLQLRRKAVKLDPNWYIWEVYWLKHRYNIPLL